MKSHDHYNGVFIPRDTQFVGHLCISGADSFAKFHGKGFWEVTDAEYSDIHGYLADGKKVSLIDCLLSGRTQYHLAAIIHDGVVNFVRHDQTAGFHGRCFLGDIVSVRG